MREIQNDKSNLRVSFWGRHLDYLRLGDLIHKTLHLCQLIYIQGYLMVKGLFQSLLLLLLVTYLFFPHAELTSRISWTAHYYSQRIRNNNLHLLLKLEEKYDNQIQTIPNDMSRGLFISKTVVGGSRIQNVMTKILNPPPELDKKF